MLTLTDNATQAIEGILTRPDVPDGAGIRIAPAMPTVTEPEATGLQVSVAEAPDETDQVVVDRGARVFMDAAVADDLEDKMLDVSVGSQGVSFALGDQA
ncbi:MAG TPA: hypothetical protein VE777_17825 [Gaiellales bacterium]|jgi:Fe-S cluster assembly iron-binding protein IscA|nr:hypothetical protein [Gaiellales bacterium]